MPAQFSRPNQEPVPDEEPVHGEEPAAPALCPRCGTALIDPNGMGWCRRCGYSRAVEQEQAAADALQRVRACSEQHPRKASSLGAAEFVQLVSVAPSWFWSVVFAGLAVLPLTYVALRVFPLGSWQRAAWGSGEFAFGLLAMAGGQVWALVMLRRRQEVGKADMLSPLRIWPAAFRLLPETRGPVTLLTTGVTAVLAAGLWVGGLLYLISGDDARAEKEEAPAQRAPDAVDRQRYKMQEEYEKIEAFHELETRNEQKRLARAARAAEGATGGDATAAVPGDAEKETKADTRPTATCVVIGYLPGTGGNVSGLVLATLRDGRLSYAGVVTQGLEAAPGLADRLAALSRPTPLIQADGLKVEARWCRAQVFCDVHYSGMDAKGRLRDPFLKKVAVD